MKKIIDTTHLNGGKFYFVLDNNELIIEGPGKNIIRFSNCKNGLNYTSNNEVYIPKYLIERLYKKHYLKLLSDLKKCI